MLPVLFSDWPEQSLANFVPCTSSLQGIAFINIKFCLPGGSHWIIENQGQFAKGWNRVGFRCCGRGCNLLSSAKRWIVLLMTFVREVVGVY